MTEPVAATDRGSLNWAIRDSFLRYVTLIARGSCTVSGAAGVEDGEFAFPLRRVRQVGAEWHFEFDGSVRLTAHQGFLDVTISDPWFVLGPEGGLLTVDTKVEGEPRLAVAVTDAAQPVANDGGFLWAAIPSRLLAAAAGLFGDAYPGGSELAPVTIRAALDS